MKAKLIKTYFAGSTLGVVYEIDGRRCSTLIGGTVANAQESLDMIFTVITSAFVSLRDGAQAAKKDGATLTISAVRFNERRGALIGRITELTGITAGMTSTEAAEDVAARIGCDACDLWGWAAELTSSLDAATREVATSTTALSRVAAPGLVALERSIEMDAHVNGAGVDAEAQAVAEWIKIFR